MACCGERGRGCRPDSNETDIRIQQVGPHGNKKDQYKLILLGQSGVGKSSILLQYVKGGFDQFSESTIGATYFYKTVSIDGKNIKLDIWDTAGQERYKCIANLYYRGAAGAVVVYDITDRNSFEEAQSWITAVLQNGNHDAQIFLVGNKLDLAQDRRAVTEEEGMLHAEKHGYFFAETSAKTAENIEGVFEKLVLKIAECGRPTRPDSNTRLT